MRKRALAAAAAMLMLAAVVANLLMLSTTAQPIEQDEAVAEKLTQTYVTRTCQSRSSDRKNLSGI